MKNIILIGFMGSGKSTFGIKLSLNLHKGFIDTDTFIEEKENMTIPEIFEKKGEPYFRALEKEVATYLSKKENFIIATGGGFVKNEELMNTIKGSGVVVYLKTSPEAVAINLKDDNSRPLLATGNKEEKIKALLLERLPLYEKYADITIDVSQRNIYTNTKQIMKALEEYL